MKEEVEKIKSVALEEIENAKDLLSLDNARIKN